jgi:hypothetical protein
MLVLMPHAVAAQEGLGRAERAHLHTIMEKTFLQVDVLRLDICLDSTAAAHVESLHAQGRSRTIDDSIARVIVNADSVLGRIRFLRNVGFGQFLDGVAEDQQKAVDAGLLPDSTFLAIRASLPEWFAFLENRDIHENDEIVYHMPRGEVQTTYVSADGDVLMQRTDAGDWRRASVLVTWFAPGSSFRDGLLDSLRRTDPTDQITHVCRPPPAG